MSVAALSPCPAQPAVTQGQYQSQLNHLRAADELSKATYGAPNRPGVVSRAIQKLINNLYYPYLALNPCTCYFYILRPSPSQINRQGGL